MRRPIDELCINKAWFGYGTEIEINTGVGFGAVPYHYFTQKMLKRYQDFPENQKFELCTRVDIETFIKEFSDFASDHNVSQKLGDILIINNIWHNTIHHYTNTWMTNRQKIVTKLAVPFRRMLVKIKNW